MVTLLAKIFVRGNDIDAPTATEIKPLASMLKSKETEEDDE